MTDEARAVRVCSVGDVAPGTSRRFEVEGHRVAVVRIGDDWYAVGDVCSHEDYSLTRGRRLGGRTCEIECPKHGSTFSLATGEPQALPATEPVPVYGVRVEGDDVELVLGQAVRPGADDRG